MDLQDSGPALSLPSPRGNEGLLPSLWLQKKMLPSAACRTRAPSRPRPRSHRRRGWSTPTSSGPTRSTLGRSSTPRPSPTPWSISARCFPVGNRYLYPCSPFPFHFAFHYSCLLRYCKRNHCRTHRV